jgi:hypothetical protein
MKRLLILAAAALLTGCGGAEQKKTIAMDQQEAVVRVAEVVRGIVDPAQDKLIKISWHEGEELSGELGYLVLSSIGADNQAYTRRVELAENGAAGERGTSLQAGEREKVRINLHKVAFADAKFLTAEDLDPAVIMAQIGLAAPMIDAGMYTVRSVAGYSVEIDPANGEKKAGFVLRITGKEGATEHLGGQTVTSYYEIRFDVRPDGSVAMIEE